MRGPAPGLGAVLTALQVPYGEAAGRAITRSTTPRDTDPWDYLSDVMARPREHPIGQVVPGYPQEGLGYS